MAPQIAEKVPCSKITGGAYFLRPSERFKVEKPYAFKFPLEDNSVQQTNMDFDKIKISATNMRGFEKSFSLETNGFAITEFDMALPYEDYHDERLILPYFRQIEDWLKERLGARHVEVFRHGIRKRHAAYPISTGEPYEYDQPTTIAHIDTTPAELRKEVERQHREAAPGLLESRVQCIWKPLKGPINDWPLLVCDATTVARDLDYEPADLLYPNLQTENAPVYHRDTYNWYYLGDHKPSEMSAYEITTTTTATTTLLVV